MTHIPAFVIALLYLLTCAPSQAGNTTSLAQQANQLPYAARSNFGARLEPENGIIHIAGQDPSSFERYASLFAPNQQPMLQMSYVTLTQGVDKVVQWGNQVQALQAKAGASAPGFQIGLNMTRGLDDGSGDAKAVATGRYDAELDAFISALSKLKGPVFVRIGYEFEGSWNNYTPEGFVSAFITITQKLRAAKLNQVATVWCAAGGSAGFVGFEQLMAFYPGDQWVDWWGVDVFSAEEITHPWLGDFYQLAAKHQKPVMIGEATPRYVGVDSGLASWQRWYQPFFTMIKRHPEIKAVSYINWDWAYWSEKLGFNWHDWKDARIERNPLVRDRYVHELSDPIWLHQSQQSALTQKRYLHDE